MSSRQAAWTPSERIFGRTWGLDHRLFSGDRMRPEVRRTLLARLDSALEPVLGPQWQVFTRAYLMGSQASRWTSPELEGNGDLDVILAVDPGHPHEDAGHINGILRRTFDRGDWHPPFDPRGTYDLTGYVNPLAWNVTDISPYAAYDLTGDRFAVDPPDLPDWSPDQFPQGKALLQEGRALGAQARALLRMPEPFRSQEARRLWDYIRSGRDEGFAPGGLGWQSAGNVLEKMLDQMPGNLVGRLKEAVYGRQVTAGAYDWAADEGPYTWEEIGDRYPRVYGEDSGDSEGIGWAASHLYHDRPGHSQDDSTGEESADDMEFHPRTVDPARIDYMRSEPGDPRVTRARRGYESQQPEKVPPLILVHRNGVFMPADGHHRAEGAARARKPVRAYVAYSPHDAEPFSDGERGPFNGAGTRERPPLTDQDGRQFRISYPGFPHTAETEIPPREASLLSHFAAWEDEYDDDHGDGQDPDRYVECDQGHRHWGAAGAAGLLIRHKRPSGEHEYLLQKRSPYVQHGGTWSTPGGALGHGETPEEGAVREGEEELGGLPDDLWHSHTSHDEHGGWKYSTVVMDSPRRFEPEGGGESDWEHGGHGWFTPEEMKDLPLHPGFAASWDRVRKSGALRQAVVDPASLPRDQLNGITRARVYYPPGQSEDRRLLDVASRPRPGTRVWRGELRPEGENPGNVQSVGMHWTVNPRALLLRGNEPGWRQHVWQGVVDDFGSQAFPRSHDVWRAVRSGDGEHEIRFRPGARVRLEGAYVSGSGTGDRREPMGILDPLHPESTDPRWEWHPMDRPVTVRHRPGAPGSPSRGGADYASLGISHEGVAHDDSNPYLMVAVVPPEHVSAALAESMEPLTRHDPEPPEEHHVTMLYLGKEKDHTPAQRAKLPGLVREWASCQQPFTVRVQGAGTFANEGEHTVHALVDMPDGHHLRTSLEEHLAGHGISWPRDHGFAPHLTLAYSQQPVRFLPSVPRSEWTAGQVHWCRGKDWQPVPLGRAPAKVN
jgi:2'-5' RNA ligase/8-oxo-dGTP pyrophosphatase MutT (NUDIX family)